LGDVLAFAEYVKHAWRSVGLLGVPERTIRPVAVVDADPEALALPGSFGRRSEGCITFVDEDKTRHKRDPGYCYLRAGYEPAGRTQGGL